MAIRRVPIALVLDEGFGEALRRTQEAAADIFSHLRLAQATWEPHDWSDFD